MEFSNCIFGASLLLLSMVSLVVNGDPLVPALCIFGDSVADVGNNNNLQTLVKANFPPYGRDFLGHTPTGRFCNGKLATDFTAEYLGFDSYPPPYLSKDGNILAGANFASAASGYYDITPQLYGALTLGQQLVYYKEWQNKVLSSVGREKANAIFSGGIHLISAGTSDFIQNYYINPIVKRAYTPDQFSGLLMRSYSTLIQVKSVQSPRKDKGKHFVNKLFFFRPSHNLYSLGARRIGVTSLPPTGCLPAAITLFGSGTNQCVPRLNGDAVSFNIKLNSTSQNLKAKLPGLKLVVFDIYQPLLDLITKSSDNGFFESRRACCGTGTFETSFMCNARSLGTCSNATEYVFWDGFHPSESANQKLAQSLLEQGFDLMS